MDPDISINISLVETAALEAIDYLINTKRSSVTATITNSVFVQYPWLSQWLKGKTIKCSDNKFIQKNPESCYPLLTRLPWIKQRTISNALFDQNEKYISYLESVEESEFIQIMVHYIRYVLPQHTGHKARNNNLQYQPLAFNPREKFQAILNSVKGKFSLSNLINHLISLNTDSDSKPLLTHLETEFNINVIQLIEDILASSNKPSEQKPQPSFSDYLLNFWQPPPTPIDIMASQAIQEAADGMIEKNWEEGAQNKRDDASPHLIPSFMPD